MLCGAVLWPLREVEKKTKTFNLLKTAKANPKRRHVPEYLHVRVCSCRQSAITWVYSRVFEKLENVCGYVSMLYLYKCLYSYIN